VPTESLKKTIITLNVRLQMNIDKIAPIAAVAIALLAVLVPEETFSYWVLILVLIGLVHGIMSPVTDRATQAMIYAGAVAVPMIAATIGGVGLGVASTFVGDFLVAFTSAIHGYAAAALVMDIKARIMG
jgi:hypothetical protein